MGSPNQFPYLQKKKLDIDFLSECTLTPPTSENHLPPFWLEYKDYLIGTINIFITIGITLLVQHITRKEKEKDNEYQSKLFFYQNKILPLHEKFIQLTIELSFLKKVISDFPSQKSTKARKIITNSIDQLENIFDSFNAKNLKILSVYDKKTEIIFWKTTEEFQDEITTLISDVSKINTTDESVVQLSHFEKSNNDFLERISLLIKQVHPTVSIKIT